MFSALDESDIYIPLPLPIGTDFAAIKNESMQIILDAASQVTFPDGEIHAGGWSNVCLVCQNGDTNSVTANSSAALEEYSATTILNNTVHLKQMKARNGYSLM